MTGISRARSRSFVFYVKGERDEPSRRCRRSRCVAPRIIVQQHEIGAVAGRDAAQFVIELQETSRD